MTNELEVRDLRHKEKFEIDDRYLNGFAKICGIYATGVYIALCRYSDYRTQESYPSLQTLADQLSIGKRTVQRAIEVLEQHGILIRLRKGKKLTNRYYLMDKSVWSHRPLSQNDMEARRSEWSDRPLPVARETTHRGQSGHSIGRTTQVRTTQKKGPVIVLKDGTKAKWHKGAWRPLYDLSKTINPSYLPNL
jgi:biotin operon repressor